MRSYMWLWLHCLRSCGWERFQLFVAPSSSSRWIMIFQTNTKIYTSLCIHHHFKDIRISCTNSILLVFTSRHAAPNGLTNFRPLEPLGKPQRSARRLGFGHSLRLLKRQLFLEKNTPPLMAWPIAMQHLNGDFMGNLTANNVWQCLKEIEFETRYILNMWDKYPRTGWRC